MSPTWWILVVWLYDPLQSSPGLATARKVRDFSYSFAEVYRKAEQTPGVATSGKPSAAGGQPASGCIGANEAGSIW
jgi:hypothetical protein